VAARRFYCGECRAGVAVCGGEAFEWASRTPATHSFWKKMQRLGMSQSWTGICENNKA
jgi:hypothetical protein